MATSTLHKKMAQAMGEIGRVPKRGRNQAQGYNYARADDVAEHTREILSKHGIAVYADVTDSGIREIETQKGKARVSWVKVAWTFVDGESGESRTVNVPGEGMDHGDKGVYKAMTGSLKYALMLGFLIPTGDADPEREEEDKPQRTPQRRASQPPQDSTAKKAEALVKQVEQAQAGGVSALDVWKDRIARASDLAELDEVKASIKSAVEADPGAWTDAEREELRDLAKKRWHAIDEARAA